MIVFFVVPARAGSPGGFIEMPGTAIARPPLRRSQIQAFLPSRGGFSFPAPYNTRGVRITNASDCGGADCVWNVGYSYWANMNESAGSDIMYIFLGLDRSRGGGGPTLFSYNKVTDQVTNLGPLFDSSSALSHNSGEGWYFSASQPTKLYFINNGTQMERYDVLTKQSQLVYDVTTQFGSGYGIWQMHSSNDDKVHGATLVHTSTRKFLGCVIFHEDSQRFQFFPQIRGFNECSLDRSGRWAMSLEKYNRKYGLNMRVFDLSSGVNLLTSGVNPMSAGGLSSHAQMVAAGVERDVLDQQGGVGHNDMGYGYTVGADNWSVANAIRIWDFTKNPLSESTTGSLVFYDNSYAAPASDHISHLNACPDLPINQQFACGSSASTVVAPWSNEIVCYALDGSFRTLVVAPVMTEMSSSVGGGSYAEEPMGNIDFTGQYFIWTSNAGGTRMDAYLVKVPAQLIGGNTGTTPTGAVIRSDREQPHHGR